MAWWWVLLAMGFALFSTPGFMQLRAARDQQVPGVGWRIDVRRLPWWAILPFFAGLFLVMSATYRLTSSTDRGLVLALGCFALSWVVQFALVRVHDRRVRPTAPAGRRTAVRDLP